MDNLNIYVRTIVLFSSILVLITGSLAIYERDNKIGIGIDCLQAAFWLDLQEGSHKAFGFSFRLGCGQGCLHDDSEGAGDTSTDRRLFVSGWNSQSL